MARSNISEEQWEKAKQYFEHGLSLSDIEKKTGISKGGISKRSKKEEWDKETPKKQLLSQAVEVTVAKNELKETPIALEVHNELHDERTRYTTLINNNATKLANKLAMMADEIEDPQDLKHLVDANDKLSITLKVSERHAPRAVTAVQVNNEEKPKKMGMGELYKTIEE